MAKLYLYNDIIYRWNPAGLHAAALREKGLHELIGVSRVQLYNYYNGKNTPRDERVPALLKHAPESLEQVAEVAPNKRKTKRPKTVDILQTPEARKLCRIIGKKQQASKTGWIRFSSTYGPAGVDAETARSILDAMLDLGAVESMTPDTTKRGPKPLEIRYTGDPQWLL